MSVEPPAVEAAVPWFDPHQPELERAIVQTVAYADVFDYPLTADEVHRYLVGVVASVDAVRAALTNGRLVPRYLTSCDGYFALAGNARSVDARRRRAGVAARMWGPALYYGRVIAALPFVRFVAVTGALTMDNVEPDADVDYLIVTEPDRLWICRALVIALVRVAALRGDRICPNYFISERALLLSERSLFSAHEVAQMVPLANLDLYRKIRELNDWTDSYLPNAAGPPKQVPVDAPRARRVCALAESGLRTSLGVRLERWEMSRKLRKFSRRPAQHAEAVFGPDWCKGHFDGHGQRVLDAFADRLHALERRST
ncbi:MAG: hypothetical protein HY329_16115 [Chloroflexi bacterium]|nr:hypothetical protein [Chloroflexota bacterium]